MLLDEIRGLLVETLHCSIRRKILTTFSIQMESNLDIVGNFFPSFQEKLDLKFVH